MKKLDTDISRRTLVLGCLGGTTLLASSLGQVPATAPAQRSPAGRLHIVNGWVLTDSDLALIGLDAG
jgi:hypothetical protein